MSFTWIPIYEELARRLLDYRSRQTELVALLEQIRGKGLTVTPLADKDAAGNRFVLREIDPFTFFGAFNRATRVSNRVGILEQLKASLGLVAPLPSDFDGIPVVNKQKSWFISFADKRGPSDVDTLWEVFSLALRDRPLDGEAFGRAFDAAIRVRNTKYNLTMGLFWIRPHEFVNLDRTMRDYLGAELPSGELSFALYEEVLERVRRKYTDIAELSHAAWRDGNREPEIDDVNYWLVGANWPGSDPEDQTSEFVKTGLWRNGYDDAYLAQVRQMKPGDRIAIKSSSTQAHGLPFPSDRAESFMDIKAVGTIAENDDSGTSVRVDWEPTTAPRRWYFYTNRRTVWKLDKSDEKARHLIRFVFEDEAQDYAYFRGAEPTLPAPPSPQGLSAPAFTTADLHREGVFLSNEDIALAVRRLEHKRNLILQGAPGVGKTFVARRLAYLMMGARDDARLTIVQFHPSYSYEDFVRGFRPTGEAGRFELADGPFLRACDRAAQDPGRSHVVLIDEINRCNLGNVFGEAFMLVESDKRGRDHQIAPLYRRGVDDTFWVPDNLYLIGTMNLADRSLALVDVALRRRFAFLTLEPQFAHDRFRDWLSARGMSGDLLSIIQRRMAALNVRIKKSPQLGHAFQVGHSFFCPPQADLSSLDEHWFRDVVDTEIAPLLEEYWYDNPDEARSAIDALRE